MAGSFVVTLTNAEGSRSWTCDDWETAYADARAESGLGAYAVEARDTRGHVFYSWSDAEAPHMVLEPARVHAATYRYTPRVAS